MSSEGGSETGAHSQSGIEIGMQATSGSVNKGNTFDRVEELEWRPDESSTKQGYVYRCMIRIIIEDIKGDDLKDMLNELLPPENLFIADVTNGSNAPMMYKELRDLIFARGGGIEKKRGLQIKKALAAYYTDDQATQDALDLAREVVVSGTKTVVAGKTGAPNIASNVESTSTFVAVDPAGRGTHEQELTLPAGHQQQRESPNVQKLTSPRAFGAQNGD